jgi:hypothetical protein
MVRFQVLTAASMKMTVTLMMEAVSTSETEVNFHQTTRHCILEDSHLQYASYYIFTYWEIKMSLCSKYFIQRGARGDNPALTALRTALLPDFTILPISDYLCKTTNFLVLYYTSST